MQVKSSKRKRPRHIILGVTASIAIYKACEIVRQLRQDDCILSVVMTYNATRLMSPQVFSALTNGQVYPAAFPVNKSLGNRESCAVFTEMFFHPDAWDSNWGLEHISLAKRADLVLIAPATANIIGKIANGIADDLLTTTVMATRAPVFIAAAMNENMYKNKLVQDNIKKLRGLGYKFIEPTIGKLACGDVGSGHLAGVAEIVNVVKRSLR